MPAFLGALQCLVPARLPGSCPKGVDSSETTVSLPSKQALALQGQSGYIPRLQLIRKHKTKTPLAVQLGEDS